MRSRAVFLAMIMLGVVTQPGLAGWEVDGASICYAAHTQVDPDIVPDGTGGAVVAWEDSRDGPGFDIYAQRVTADGTPVWSLQGVPVCVAAGDQGDLAMVPDGGGGAFIAWADQREAEDWNIYAQHLDGAGNPTWAVDGVVVVDAVYEQSRPAMVSDGAGGVILVWNDGRGFGLGLSFDLYAQRLDAHGVPQWAADGVTVVSEVGAQRNPSLLADGAGGMFLAWEDSRLEDGFNDLSYDVYAARLTAAGVESWSAQVLSALHGQINIHLAPDADGGVLVFWRDGRDLGIDIYGSRVTAGGDVLFPADTATAIVQGEASENLAAVVPDAVGGAMVFWHHNDAGVRDLRAQRVDGSLTGLWTAGGLVVCEAADVQASLRAVSDGHGGALVIWQDSRNAGQEDVYAQRLDPEGVGLWGVDGTPVCLDPAVQLMPVLCGDGHGGAIMAWHDQRQGTAGDIWGHHVDTTGALVPVMIPWQEAVWRDDAVQVRWRYVGEEPSAWQVTRAVWPHGTPVSVAAPIQRNGGGECWINDRSVLPGSTYTYQVGGPEAGVLFATEPFTVPTPAASLAPPYPNPSNPGTCVSFALDASRIIKLTVHDLAGRRVAVLADGAWPAGRHTLDWNGRDDGGRSLAAGAYVIRLAGEGLVASQKFLLVR